ncbi:uncharacterized protein LOC143446079 isoform X2 [Clavelina lepadiformis]|uniref:uncharacterized protein LOC143446079 isoform X2 n=1 Tax=Clavelina lepadiformis TaxID=159417 RepID=UPI0040428FBB
MWAGHGVNFLRMESLPDKSLEILVVVGAVDDEDNVKYVIASIKAGIQEWAQRLQLASVVDGALLKFDAKFSVSTNSEGLAPTSTLSWEEDETEIRVIVSPTCFDVNREIARLLIRPSSHRLVVYGGHSIDGRANWYFQDGVFERDDLEYVLTDRKLTSALQTTNTHASLTISCLQADQWKLKHENPLIDITFLDPFKAAEEKKEKRSPVSKGMSKFVESLEDALSEQVQGIFSQLEPPSQEGFLKIRNPCLYVFPSGNGDSAYFTVNGFSILINGGALSRPGFWRIVRHQESVDCIIATHLGSDSLTGINSFFLRKVQEKQLKLPMDNTTEEYKQISRSLISPDVGCCFMNAPLEFAEIAYRKGSTSMVDEDVNGQNFTLQQQLDLKTVDLVKDTLRLSKALNLELSPLTRNPDPVPITLFSKYGVGKLELYVISPDENSKELAYVREKWGCDDKSCNQKGKTGVTLPSGEEGKALLSDLASICCLLVWRPASPSGKIVRVLFPGNTSQDKIFEGLEKIKNKEFLSLPCPTEAILKARHVNRSKTAKPTTSRYGSTELSKSSHTSTARMGSSATNHAVRASKSDISRKAITTRKQNVKGEPLKRPESAKAPDSARSKRDGNELVKPADKRPKADKPERPAASSSSAASTSKTKPSAIKSKTGPVQAKAEARVKAKQTTAKTVVTKSTTAVGSPSKSDSKTAKPSSSKVQPSNNKKLASAISDKQKKTSPAKPKSPTAKKSMSQPKESSKAPQKIPLTPPEDLTDAFAKLSPEVKSAGDKPIDIKLTKRPTPEGQSVGHFDESAIKSSEVADTPKEVSVKSDLCTKTEDLTLQDEKLVEKVDSEYLTVDTSTDKTDENAIGDTSLVGLSRKAELKQDVLSQESVEIDTLHASAVTKDSHVFQKNVENPRSLENLIPSGTDTTQEIKEIQFSGELQPEAPVASHIMDDLNSLKSGKGVVLQEQGELHDKMPKDEKELNQDSEPDAESQVKIDMPDFQNGDTPYFPVDKNEIEETQKPDADKYCTGDDIRQADDFQNGDIPYCPVPKVQEADDAKLDAGLQSLKENQVQQNMEFEQKETEPMREYYPGDDLAEDEEPEFQNGDIPYFPTVEDSLGDKYEAESDGKDSTDAPLPEDRGQSVFQTGDTPYIPEDQKDHQQQEAKPSVELNEFQDEEKELEENKINTDDTNQQDSGSPKSESKHETNDDSQAALNEDIPIPDASPQQSQNVEVVEQPQAEEDGIELVREDPEPSIQPAMLDSMTPVKDEALLTTDLCEEMSKIVDVSPLSSDPYYEGPDKEDNSVKVEVETSDRDWLGTPQSSEPQSMITDTTPTSDLQSEDLQIPDQTSVDQQNTYHDITGAKQNKMSVTPLSSVPSTPPGTEEAQKQDEAQPQLYNHVDQDEEERAASLEKDETSLVDLAFTYSTTSTTSKIGLMESPYSTEVDSIYNIPSMGGSGSAALTTGTAGDASRVREFSVADTAEQELDESSEAKREIDSAQLSSGVFDSNGNQTISIWSSRIEGLEGQQRSAMPVLAWSDGNQAQSLEEDYFGKFGQQGGNKDVETTDQSALQCQEPVQDRECEQIHGLTVEQSAEVEIDKPTSVEEKPAKRFDSGWRFGISSAMTELEHDLGHLHAEKNSTSEEEESYTYEVSSDQRAAMLQISDDMYNLHLGANQQQQQQVNKPLQEQQFELTPSEESELTLSEPPPQHISGSELPDAAEIKDVNPDSFQLEFEDSANSSKDFDGQHQSGLLGDSPTDIFSKHVRGGQKKDDNDFQPHEIVEGLGSYQVESQLPSGFFEQGQALTQDQTYAGSDQLFNYPAATAQGEQQHGRNIWEAEPTEFASLQPDQPSASTHTFASNNPFAAEFLPTQNNNNNHDEDFVSIRKSDPMAQDRPTSSKTKKQTTSMKGKKDKVEHPAFYVDLAYIPHHVNKNHCGIEFFKRIRSKYYVISGFDARNDEPNEQTLVYLLEAKKTWGKPSEAPGQDDGNVTVIPTHNSSALSNWYQKYKELTAENIHLVASGSKVLMHNETVEACKIEF